MYRISNSSAKEGDAYKSFSVYNCNDDVMAIVITDLYRDKERLNAIHVLNEQCSLDEVLKASRLKGYYIESYYVVDFPARNFFAIK